jgi:protein-tyrosine phosphatase
MTLATRQVALEGGGNFRDLGGYRTEDGRRVRWGRLFRSGTLAYLTGSDWKLLTSLDIRNICDLRTTAERDAEPTSWKPQAVRTMTWDYELDGGAVMGAFRVGTPTPERVRAAILEFYLTAPEDFADRLCAIFDLLGADEVPLILHCTAGKDRTGVAAAIVLRALGVPPHTVIEDYALSDGSVDVRTLTGSAVSGRNDPWRFLATLSPELRAPLMAADPAYLKAMLDDLDRRYGSLHGYLASRIGITQAALERIRDRHLEGL